MKKVTLLAMQNAVAFSVTTPMDVFSQAGIMWNYFNGANFTPHFNVELVTSTGKPFKTLFGARMVPNGSIYEVKDTDLIIVSSILDIDKTLRAQGEVIDWLINQYQAGSHIATICTGAFVLAETGLLDGKTATTHWAVVDLFKKRYPQVRLKPERLITDEGDLFCSGGYNAGMDLSLYLVEKYCGHEVALQSSKSLIADGNRSSQAPYIMLQHRKDHGDDRILALQEWIERNFDRTYNYDDLVDRSGMSHRTLVRRFKAATGETPLSYQQNLRIEAAKRLLENGMHSFDEITYKVGYADSSTFRKIFSKHTGLRPADYRKKFQRTVLV
ncbi:MAG: helix-turn-helix domain-containing protein [Desulfobacteraceae bacterium]|jgi:transcriptional regulator GlxA family with amidase domain